MTAQEATERMVIAMMGKLSKPEKQRCFRIQRELEKVLRDAGPLGLIAFGALAAELQSRRKPGEVIIEQEAPKDETPEA